MGLNNKDAMRPIQGSLVPYPPPPSPLRVPVSKRLVQNDDGELDHWAAACTWLRQEL